MQIKLPEDVVKKFEGKSPDDIIAALRSFESPAAAAAAAKPDAPTLPANVISLSDFTAYKVEVSERMTGLASKIADLESGVAKAQEAAAAAKTDATNIVTAAIAKSGIPAPLAGSITKPSDGSLQTDAKNGDAFKQSVQAHKAKGLSMAEAIHAAIRENPAAYDDWRKNGNGKLS